VVHNATALLLLLTTFLSASTQYRFYTDEPLWPFGFSLHYTTFSAEWVFPPATHQTVQALTSGLTFTMALTNTGKVASAKPVQLYVRQLGVIDAPLRSLAALEKV